MTCLSPVILKNGLAVPCGKCEICRSNSRNEWSIRLAIHLASCDRMPMFITLTYDDKHIPVNENGNYTLDRKDVSSFLKAYKRKYRLLNKDFQYFGCGEYGSNYKRPHMHLLFFGDKELYNLYFDDSEAAQARIQSVWNLGFVYIGVAGFDGIHYVTKYVLKDELDGLPVGVKMPFTIASNGLGMNFLSSEIGKKYVKQLEWLQHHKDEVLAGCPSYDEDDLSSIDECLDYLKRYIPDFNVILDDGRKVRLPRAIRKRLVGSFEYFKDSPYWYYQHLQNIRDSLAYYRQYSEYDLTHELNRSYVSCLTRLEKIKKRLLEKQYNNRFNL